MEQSPNPNNWARYSGIGFQIAIYILIFWWIGSKLEIKYDVRPWGSLIGLLVGVFAGLYELGKLIFKKK